ncbi:MAG: hypothetical protein LH481_05220 [Burkholderiales bacterium]|nr:hypothetical protein [Burkholderiales bacterium]
MKLARILAAFAALASVAVMVGCASTLFFPVHPAEKAADKLIDDIWPGVAKSPTPEAKKQ